MGKYIIKGNKKLSGDVQISGSKNAVLPILSATLINSGESVVKNCPDITDVNLTCDILEDLGCTVKREDSTIIINSKNAINKRIEKGKADKIRSSILFMGVMLGRFGSVVISKPGGCAIGERPIDFHLKAMEKLGAEIIEHETIIECRAKELIGAEIFLPMPSVGATENIMLAAATAKGQTTIYNAAREPEIYALQEYLKTIGVEVCGAGSDRVVIEGKKDFHSSDYSVIPDRIEAGTFMVAGALTKGEMFLKNVDWIDMRKTIEILSDCGCLVNVEKQGIYLKAPKKIKSVPLIRTGGYPLFPTDMQPAIMTMLTMAQGTSIIIEQMFENRFCHAIELNKMGAKISAKTSVAIIDGVKKLNGGCVTASDLRAGSALVLAGLAAKGKTEVDNVKYILRGYENFDEKLRQLGADIKFIPTNDGE